MAPVLWTLLLSTAQILWQDPGNIESLDLAGSLDPAIHDPKPPFKFVKEDLSGTQPKLFVKDASGLTWNVKFGNEIKGETFSTRLVRAMGYYATPTFFVPGGDIQNMGSMKRRDMALSSKGHFTEARFQLRDPQVQFADGKDWMWLSNPFIGTPQLSGLKILMMLVSNYDNKDATPGVIGSNTGVFVRKQGSRKDRFYAFSDWGSTMGSWGDLTGATNWRCDLFAEQTKDFIRGVADGFVEFGYVGHIPKFSSGIPVAHVHWLIQYLGRISDDQLRAGLRAAGANAQEQDCYARALRERIEALRRL